MDISEYQFKTELHAHTSPVSACSEISPEDVIKKYAECGYHSVVISNHFDSGMKWRSGDKDPVDFYLSGYREACAAGEKYNINVILGCEIRFDENCNDYLLFGIDADDLKIAYTYLEKGIKEFSKFFRTQQRALVQAHPFRDGMADCAPEFLDGIEAFNMHPHHNSRISVAAKYAEQNNFIVTGGTDFHHDGHQGLCALLTKTEIKDSFQLAQVLRSRDYLFQIGNSIVIPYGK